MVKDKPNKITATLQVTVTGEFYDDEASEETLRYCIEQDLEDAGFDVDVSLLKEQGADTSKYQYKYDHTDCIWYHSDEQSRCPSSCSQYRDGWNDAMDYIFKDGKGYQPYIRKEGR